MADDIIDSLAGVSPDSRLDAIRARRPQARANAERSYRELFKPRDPHSLPLSERLAVAAFVAGLHRTEPTAAHYARLLSERVGDDALSTAIAEAVASAAATGPYGRYPSAALKAEDRDGLVWRPDEQQAAIFGPRLGAALAQAHMLTLHPRDARPEALQALLDAGLTTTEIVTLSQLVAFLSFQIRVVAGLRLLAA
jgi:CMD domain protein